MFYCDATIHDDAQSPILRTLRRLLIDDAELHPDCGRSDRNRLLNNWGNLFGLPENINEIDP
jgi:hypothetical protein